MKPTEDEIRTAAYYRWIRLGKRSGLAEEDWVESEQDATLKINYDILFACKLNVGKRIYIGDPDNRICRYCQRTEPATTFNKEAHALPELIGNKMLIALDECDRCNEFFSRNLEDHFSKFTLPHRAALGMVGKKGVPSYKSNNKAARLDYISSQRAFSVADRYDSTILTPDPQNKSFRLDLQAQPYIPVAVFKCLAKMALAIMPFGELSNYRSAIAWILDPDHSRPTVAFQNLGCYLYFAPSPFPHPWAAVLRRMDPSAPLPYMLFMIANGQLMIEVYLPLCENDRHIEGQVVTVPKYDLTMMPGQENSTCKVILLGSSDYERETKLTLNMRYNEEREDD
jgi:hypothetical protein